MNHFWLVVPKLRARFFGLKFCFRLDKCTIKKYADVVPKLIRLCLKRLTRSDIISWTFFQQHVLVGPESSNAQIDEPRALKRKQDELVQEVSFRRFLLRKQKKISASSLRWSHTTNPRRATVFQFGICIGLPVLEKAATARWTTIKKISELKKNILQAFSTGLQRQTVLNMGRFPSTSWFLQITNYFNRIFGKCRHPFNDVRTMFSEFFGNYYT